MYLLRGLLSLQTFGKMVPPTRVCVCVCVCGWVLPSSLHLSLYTDGAEAVEDSLTHLQCFVELKGSHGFK